MSNGDDVLDDWEEIDEVGLTNTLQKIQAERETLQKQQNQEATKTSILKDTPQARADSSVTNFPPMKLLQRNTAQDASHLAASSSSSAASAGAPLKSPLDDMAATFQPVMMVLHKSNDEYQSANYTQPTNLQTVKILRRPTQSTEPRNNGIRPRQPIKTLQQREQAYAEARLRILGSAKNPEDDVAAATTNAPSSTTTTSTPTTNTTFAIPNTKGNMMPTSTVSKMTQQQQQQQQLQQNAYNNHYQQHLQQQQQQQHLLLQQQNYYYLQQQQQQFNTPPPAYNNRAMAQTKFQQQMQQVPSTQQQQQQTWSPVVGGSVSSPLLRQQQQESILRLPRGPDGSNGFSVRR